jgi:2-iminobutanoate/2-iminopropanoate deaminase
MDMQMPFTPVSPPNFSRAMGAPYSVATLTMSGPLLHISGQPPRGDDGETVGIGDIEKQTHQVMRRIKTIVETQNASMKDVCRLLIFITDRSHLAKMMEVRKLYFSEPYPAATAVIASLVNPEWLIEVEATVALPPH